MTTVEGASIDFARRLFTRGTDIFGAEEIKKAFDLTVTDIPPIPFTEEELAVARKRDEMLIFQSTGITMKKIHELTGNKTSDGKPLCYDIGWYENEPFYTDDPLRPGWRLISREVIPDSLNENYLGQTEALSNHLTRSVFAEMEMPKAVAEAIKEFCDQKEELEKLLSKDWKETAKRSVSLKINQLFRQSPAEALWSLALYERANRERLLQGRYNWTNQLSSRGYVVPVGSFDGLGVDVSNPDPRDSRGYLGFCFSRSGELVL